MNENQTTIKRLCIIWIIISLMLLAVLVLALVSMNLESDISDKNSDQQTDSSTESKDTSATSVGKNNTPLFETVTTRTSYVIEQDADVKQIENIKSQHSILVDLDTYKSIAEKGADDKIYPASMTKVMTLIVACERITDLDEEILVTEELVKFAYDNEGSGVGLVAGESYRVEDLLYLITYQSDTIASILIAEYIAGSEQAFVSLMNAKADELGLVNTHFSNCTGLYDDSNYTTCREMSSIMAYAMDNEMAYKCLSSYTGRSMMIGENKCTFYCGWYSYRFDDNPKFTGGKIIAGKTGYTDESGYTLVSCAEIEGKKYVNVIVTRTDKNSTVKVQEGPSADEVKYIYKTYS